MDSDDKNVLTNRDALDIMCSKVREELKDMTHGTAKITIDLEKHNEVIKDVKHEIIEKINHSRK